MYRFLLDLYPFLSFSFLAFAPTNCLIFSSHRPHFQMKKKKELGLLQHFFTDVYVLFGLTTDQTLPCLNKKISEAK